MNGRTSVIEGLCAFAAGLPVAVRGVLPLGGRLFTSIPSSYYLYRTRLHCIQVRVPVPGTRTVPGYNVTGYANHSPTMVPVLQSTNGTVLRYLGTAVVPSPGEAEFLRV